MNNIRSATNTTINTINDLIKKYNELAKAAKQDFKPDLSGAGTNGGGSGAGGNQNGGSQNGGTTVTTNNSYSPLSVQSVTGERKYALYNGKYYSKGTASD
jgi:hypothetical protein